MLITPWKFASMALASSCTLAIVSTPKSFALPYQSSEARLAQRSENKWVQPFCLLIVICSSASNVRCLFSFTMRKQLPFSTWPLWSAACMHNTNSESTLIIYTHGDKLSLYLNTHQPLQSAVMEGLALWFFACSRYKNKQDIPFPDADIGYR